MANPRQPQQDHFGDAGIGVVLGQRHATNGDQFEFSVAASCDLYCMAK